MANRQMILAACALTLALAPAIHAQTKPDTRPEPKPEAPARDYTAFAGPQFPDSVHNRTQANDYRQANSRVHTFYLKNAANPNDGNEILTGLRLMLDPGIKLYLIPSQNAIAMDLLPLEVEWVEQYLAAWDRPHKQYRLSYTVTETDGGKPVGVQHYSIVAVSGQRATLKNGSKVPIVTGAYNSGEKGSTAKDVQTQFQYLDLGLNIDTTLSETAGGAQLKTKVEVSSIGGASTIAGVDEPVIRQTVIEGTEAVVPGKPLSLADLDVVGSTRHLQIEVTMEPVR